MSNKFLGSTSTNLTNGTANLFISEITVDSLSASLPIKTNSTKTLISTKLDISDVNNLQAELDTKLSNPMVADLDFQGFAGNNINDIEFPAINRIYDRGYAENPHNIKQI